MPEVKVTEAAAANMKGAAVCFVKNAEHQKERPEHDLRRRSARGAAVEPGRNEEQPQRVAADQVIEGPAEGKARQTAAAPRSPAVVATACSSSDLNCCAMPRTAATRDTKAPASARMETERPRTYERPKIFQSTQRTAGYKGV